MVEHKKKPKLTYFNLYARGEAIRMLLHHKKVDFEDEIINPADWSKLKRSGRFPQEQLPVFETEDGTVLHQSAAIIRYLGMVYGYYPEDPEQAYWCDWSIDTVNDAMRKNPHSFLYNEKSITDLEAMKK